MVYIIWANLIILIASIIVLVKSADYIVRGIYNISKEFGISEYLLGFGIVALGTSLPELLTAVFGSLKRQSQLVLGNLIGANLIDVTLVLGIMAIIGKKIKIKAQMFKTFDQTLFMTLGMLALPFVLGFNGIISRIEGLILILAFGFYMFFLIKREERFIHRKYVVKSEIYKDIILLIIGIPLLLISADYLVDSAVSFADTFNISPYIIGLAVVAIGTTIPELTVEIRSVLKKRGEIGFGDIIGSIITNISLILGIAAIINPIFITRSIFISTWLFMVLAAFVALLFLQKKYVTWKEGVALCFIYATFLISEIILV